MALQTRPPVVTILGHVDHGKTTLLDFIRKTSVAAKEHGGITQAIGAYQTERSGKTITFIDTPGHAAFEKMRARGAQLADIAVLVVAADDGVMPQTVEAIKHIKSAGIPLIVAVNKIDLPGVDIKVQTEKIKKQLSDNEVLIEEYGGDVPIVLVSAKTGQRVPDLLETIILVAEIHELKGDSARPAVGIIIESRLDKFKGAIATVLIRDGSLKKGDMLKAGNSLGKIKGMFDWTGKSLEVAGPSVPVEVLGFTTVPMVGARLGEELAARSEVSKKAAGLIEKLRGEETEVLNVIVKADNQGSLEAIESVIEKFNTEGEHVKLIFSGTGEIGEADIDLAAATKAIVLGFNVGVKSVAEKRAETEHVLIRKYKIIYELIEELEDVVEGILRPGKVEEVFGRAQIIAEFPYGKGEKIAGCKILEGIISKGPKIRVRREVAKNGEVISSEVIGDGKIKMLKRLKEDVPRVEKGQECGMLFDTPLDFQLGDIVESFRPL